MLHYIYAYVNKQMPNCFIRVWEKKMLFNIVNLQNAQYTSAPKVYPQMLSLSSVFPYPFMRIMMIWSFI